MISQILKFVTRRYRALKLLQIKLFILVYWFPLRFSFPFFLLFVWTDEYLFYIWITAERNRNWLSYTFFFFFKMIENDVTQKDYHKMYSCNDWEKHFIVICIGTIWKRKINCDLRSCWLNCHKQRASSGKTKVLRNFSLLFHLCDYRSLITDMSTSGYKSLYEFFHLCKTWENYSQK